MFRPIVVDFPSVAGQAICEKAPTDDEPGMGLLTSSLLALRRDRGVIEKLPSYLSVICVLAGIVWLLLLPLDDYSRRTYISENALLPGQVHTYFSGSEQKIFNAYKHEVVTLAGETQEAISSKLVEILKSSGLKVATQKYEYTVAGNIHQGENVYGILHAPRGDATEAVVLVAAWKNTEEQLNQHGVTLALTLARYFKRWSLWSKDIIFLISSDSKAGPQAWIEAYHDDHSTKVESLPLKSGALEGAIVIDNPLDHTFESIHITYEGINGQLPNLDLFNTAVSISSGQHGIPTSLQRMWKSGDSYRERLSTIFRGMVNQGLGHSTGPHSSFIPYHVDAITLKTVGSGWQDDMALGRVVESLFRSLNNLMEHFHQSFFLYLLMHSNRFVSIGTYLPSAMGVAVSFSIMALALWVASGRPPPSTTIATPDKPLEKEKVEVFEAGDTLVVIPKEDTQVLERELLLPVAAIAAVHILGVVPLYLFTNTRQQNLGNIFYAFLAVNAVLPYIIATMMQSTAAPTLQQRMLIKSFSLLLLGMFLASLATVNFSLSLFIGVLASPLSLVGTKPSPEQKTSGPRKLLEHLVLQALSPPVVIAAICASAGVSVESALSEAAFAWHVWGVWTQVIIWGVWWPAWLAGVVGISLQT